MSTPMAAALRRATTQGQWTTRIHLRALQQRQMQARPRLSFSSTRSYATPDSKRKNPPLKPQASKKSTLPSEKPESQSRSSSPLTRQEIDLLKPSGSLEDQKAFVEIIIKRLPAEESKVVKAKLDEFVRTGNLVSAIQLTASIVKRFPKIMAVGEDSLKELAERKGMRPKSQPEAEEDSTVNVKTEESASKETSSPEGEPVENKPPPKRELSDVEVDKLRAMLDSFEETAPATLRVSAKSAVATIMDQVDHVDRPFFEEVSKYFDDKNKMHAEQFAAAYMTITLRADGLAAMVESAPKSDSAKSSSQGPIFGQNPNSKGGQKQIELKLDNTTIIGAALALYFLYSMSGNGETRKAITWQEFRTAFLEKGLVERLEVVGGNQVKVELHRNQTAQMYPESPISNPRFGYAFSIGSVEAFERQLDQAQAELGIPGHERIPVSYATDSTWASMLMNFGPTVLLIGATFFIFRRASGGAGGGGQSGIFGFGKSRAKMFNQESDIKVRFKDVAGMDEAKQEIMEFVSFLKDPTRFQRLGAKIPRGAILSGPPGTGKTLIAKATAGEAQVPFFSVSGSEFVEMFVGVGPSRVRDLFARARKNAPCIIFVDEIDAIGKSRGKNSFGGDNERESTLNQLLTEMDGFNTTEQVVVLAGTNRPDVLDKALMRPGRFDRHISLDRPTMEGRKQIFKVHLGNVVTEKDTDKLAGRLAALTPGFSGADISNCVNEGALIAARTKAERVLLIHFEQAIERVIGGLEKKSLVLSPEEKKTVAYHEAGHAVCGWFFKYADPLLKVSIIPRGSGALGYAQYLPAGDTYLMNVSQLMDRMAMTLGGRVSEELHFETVTSGASDDFNKVTRMATAMVTKWGMSKKLGYLHYDEESTQFQKPFSENTAQTIDSEVRRIVDEAYQKCKELLTDKKKEVGLVAEELLSKEVLGRDDMVRLLGKRPFEENKDFAKFFGSDGTKLPGISKAPPLPQELAPKPTGTLG